ncbi:hypothetical protein B0I35DRAFT_441186 [Stachybotrys elegans]|uniref:Uncharacterized protein n=1 Tax=Stachybotrys elegans TaxID=80388 RepID=A0A8K0WLE3_9HYPO|nr:hypothetical protein B0I35DRAFT_441186 [Stachybotrys elegans]
MAAKDAWDHPTLRPQTAMLYCHRMVEAKYLQFLGTQQYREVVCIMRTRYWWPV